MKRALSPVRGVICLSTLLLQSICTATLGCVITSKLKLPGSDYLVTLPGLWAACLIADEVSCQIEFARWVRPGYGKAMVCWVCVTKDCEGETSRRLFACLDYTRPTHMTNWTHDLSRTVPRLFLGSQAHLVCAWELSCLCGKERPGAHYILRRKALAKTKALTDEDLVWILRKRQAN